MLTAEPARFNRHQKVIIVTEEGERIAGRVRSVIPQNRHITADNPLLIHNTFVVEHKAVCPRTENVVDTVTRFHQRRSGHVFASKHWKLEPDHAH